MRSFCNGCATNKPIYYQILRLHDAALDCSSLNRPPYIRSDSDTWSAPRLRPSGVCLAPARPEGARTVSHQFAASSALTMKSCRPAHTIRGQSSLPAPRWSHWTTVKYSSQPARIPPTHGNRDVARAAVEEEQHRIALVHPAHRHPLLDASDSDSLQPLDAVWRDDLAGVGDDVRGPLSGERFFVRCALRRIRGTGAAH